jgi:predicted aconitase with swiveling domain
VDPKTGSIIDARHPQRGASVTGVVLFMPEGRGSSSSSTVLAECIRAGTAPGGIVLRRVDPITVLGSVVAAELYGKACPVVLPAEEAYDAVRSGLEILIEAGDRGATLLVRPGPER